jgi:uncharacterized repeat protein (TIGR01451 family)
MEYIHNNILEDESRIRLKAFLLGWVVEDINNDHYGLDLQVVITEDKYRTERNNGVIYNKRIIKKDKNITNEVFQVQLKATEQEGFTSEIVKFAMETKHLVYYENNHLPVYIILWIKPKSYFYYTFAQKYIREILTNENPIWKEQDSVTIKMNKLEGRSVLERDAISDYLYIVNNVFAELDKEKPPISIDNNLPVETVKYLTKQPCLESAMNIISILKTNFVNTWRNVATLPYVELEPYEVTVLSSVLNMKNGDRWTTAITAKKGDDIFYRITINNPFEKPLTGVTVRTLLPSGIRYVNNYAKYYYKDAQGHTLSGPVSDGIATTGISCVDIPEKQYVYITFKATVNDDAISGGIYSASNQVVANGGVGKASNSGIIIVD